MKRHDPRLILILHTKRQGHHNLIPTHTHTQGGQRKQEADTFSVHLLPFPGTEMKAPHTWERGYNLQSTLLPLTHKEPSKNAKEATKPHIGKLTAYPIKTWNSSSIVPLAPLQCVPCGLMKLNGTGGGSPRGVL